MYDLFTLAALMVVLTPSLYMDVSGFSFGAVLVQFLGAIVILSIVEPLLPSWGVWIWFGLAVALVAAKLLPLKRWSLMPAPTMGMYPAPHAMGGRR